MTIQDIDIHYRTPLVGEHNQGVYQCPECGEELMSDNKNGSIFENALGFADSKMGIVIVVECPVWFTKWYCHGGDSEASYRYFLRYISFKRQKHFKIIYNGL